MEKWDLKIATWLLHKVQWNNGTFTVEPVNLKTATCTLHQLQWTAGAFTMEPGAGKLHQMQWNHQTIFNEDPRMGQLECRNTTLTMD